MELNIAGTNLELSQNIQNYIERKLGKLDRHSPGLNEARVEISEEGTKSPEERYLVRVTLTSGAGGAVFHGEERGEDLQKAVDKVNVVMKRQLERHKGKLYDRGRGSSKVRGRFNGEITLTGSDKQVVKRKNFLLEPMTLDEAIGRMEELGHSFFLYLDADTELIKLVYRRNEGNYGLIEPTA